MGIFIKNIEKPKTCLECRFTSPPEGECWFVDDKEKCPIIEVEKPHGDLIDGEALFQIIDIDIEIDGEENARVVTEAFTEIFDTIRNMPTIIGREI